MKNISLMLSVILMAAYIMIPHSQALTLGLSTHSLQEAPILSRLTYPFLHASMTHLMINVYCLLSLSFLADARVWQFMVSLVIAWTIPSAIVADIPTLGISAANFALTGLLLMNNNKWWWLLTINMLVILCTTLLSGIAILAHLYALLIGAAIGFVLKPQFK